MNASLNDTLKVINDDMMKHHVTISNGITVLNDSSQKPKSEGGKEIIVPLDKIGKIHLECKIHPNMTLDIIVQK